MRAVDKRYEDPLDQVWRGCAQALGIAITRSSEVFASYDGRGTLTLGTEDTLDEDDCLAQMVLHELCHWLVQGDDAKERPDWGLDNMSEQDLDREHACVALQAALLMPFGLEHVLAPTTEHRAFYDACLARSRDTQSAHFDALGLSDNVRSLATDAFTRSSEAHWRPLHEALSATEQIVRAASPYADERALLR